MTDIKKPTKHHESSQTMSEPKSDHNSLGLPERRKTGRKVLLVLLIVLLVAALCVAGTWYYMNKKLVEQKKQQNDAVATLNSKVSDLESQLKTAQEATADTKPTASETKAKIIADIPTKKYSDLSSVMADDVNVVITASEKQGKVSKAQAISDLAYLNSGTSPWNFALPTGTINMYKIGSYKTHLASATIFGASANKYFVAFSLDDDNKISQIFMAANTDLLE